MTIPADFSNARFSDYLRSLSDALWWKTYAFMDEIDESTWFEFELDSKTQDKPAQPGEKPTEKTLLVLQAIQNYAHEKKILIVGSPGAGKSTLLARLLWQAAQVAQQNGEAPIPVLVELKLYSKAGIWLLIQTALENRDLYLEISDIKHLVQQRRLLLLADGLNELLNDRRAEFRKFCGRDIAVIVTSRDGTDNFGFGRKLQLQALSDAKVEAFLQRWLPGRAQVEIKALSDRVKKLEPTPLMVWMLFSIFQQNGDLPTTRGLAYRTFITIYAEKAKEGIDLDESRGLLSRLAFELMHAAKLIDLRLDISEVDAQNLLGSKKALDHLVRNHLLQAQGRLGNRRISFCHQSLQEYYAAEALLVMLHNKHPDVMDDQRLQHFYLNYLKWTEPLAMMLALLEDATQALRVVRLALNVDWRLGARLAGEVRSDFQQKTIGALNQLIEEKQLPEWLKVELWGQTRAEAVMPGLLRAIEDDDDEIRERAVNALGNIGCETAVPALLQAIEDDNWGICTNAVKAIGKISSESVLLDLIEHSNSVVRKTAIDMLGLVGSDIAIPALLKAIEDLDWCVRRSAVEALGQIGSDIAIPALLKAIEDSHFLIQWSAASALGQIGSDIAIPGLLIALKHLDSGVSSSAANALQKIGSDASITALRQATQGSYHNCVMVNALSKDALGEICHTLGNLDKLGTIRYSEESISNLRQVIKDCDPEMRLSAVNRLTDHDPILTMPLLCEAIKDPSLDVRLSAINTLGTIVFDVAIPGLLQALKDTNSVVRWKAAGGLGNFQNDRAAHILPNLLTLLPTESGEAAFYALTAIQANCQFYNYEIAQWELTPAEPQASTVRNPVVHQHFHGPTHGVAGTVGGNQNLCPPPNSID